MQATDNQENPSLVYEYNILCGIFSSTKMLTLKSLVKPTYFIKKSNRELFMFARNFYAKHRTPVTVEVVKDQFDSALFDIKQDVLNTLNKLNTKIDDALFEHSLEKFLENHKHLLIQKGKSSLVNSSERAAEHILKELNQLILDVKSVDNARQKVYYSSDEEHNQDFVKDILTSSDNVKGIPTSNPSINKITGGMKKKKLWVVAGAPGECKSTQLINWAYDCIVHGGNIFYCTIEMSEDEVKKNLWALHIYKKYNYVLDTQKLNDNASLSEEDKNYLEKAREDFTNFKGQIIVFELPSKYKFSNIESKLLEEHQKRKIDAVFIDYLLLLKPDEKRNQRHEEDEQMFKDAKQLANTFDNNEGTFVCTAHQINTEGIKRARKRGHYVFEDFAKTAEARNSPDFAISNWMDDILREQNEIKQKVHKNRGGSLPTDTWNCPTELACSAINPPLSFEDDIPENIKLD